MTRTRDGKTEERGQKTRLWEGRKREARQGKHEEEQIMDVECRAGTLWHP